jgi:NAD(P)-dependent dehydrogenase (short-subunit alcohol dehydrogenase family)
MTTIALITGANKGLGFAVARQLAKQGIEILIGARDLEKGTTAAKQLQEEGLKAEFLLLDVTQEESVKNAAQTVQEKQGKLDILVNNAGINPEFSQGITTFGQLSLDLMVKIYETNVFGAFLATRAFLPLLRNSAAGRIVNVSSTVGSMTDQGNPASMYYGVRTIAYSSSKAALNALTVQLAKELSSTSLKANSACPGWVKTDLGSEAAPTSVAEGAQIIVKLATLGEDGPSGGFFNEAGTIPW